jgi:redox-sensitive bicupin YhaK (pirin superfamily)
MDVREPAKDRMLNSQLPRSRCLFPYKGGHERTCFDLHPHKGLKTVTVAYQGELEHRDSSGGGGTIGAGDVYWMAAGNGIVHEEFHLQDFTRESGTLQMVRLWVNLRAKDKSAKPGCQTLLKSEIPTLDLPQAAGTVRVIAGEPDGTKDPAKTFAPINLWDVNLRAGKSADLPLPDGHTSAFLVLSAEVSVHGERKPGEGDLAIFARAGDGITVKANSDAKLLVMAGQPIADPVVDHGLGGM